MKSILPIVLFISCLFFSLSVNAQVSFNTINHTSIDSFPSLLTSGDFNNDAKLDIVSITAQNNRGYVSLLLGNGQGNFSFSFSFSLTASPTSIVSGDFNGDNKMDVAVSHYTLNAVSVFLGDGQGNFSSPTLCTVYGSSMSALSRNDFNGDGKTDLAVSLRDSSCVAVLLTSPSGSFNPAIYFPVTSSPINITSDDFNGDGKKDIATVHYSFNTISILTGMEREAFQLILVFLQQ